MNATPDTSTDTGLPPSHQRVRDSLALIAPKADAVAAYFYEQLLTRHPALQKLFARTDFGAQGKALMSMIVWAVQQLDQPEVLAKRLRELGRRHDGYGVKPEHYDLVGECLLGALETQLGEAFDDELRLSWAEVYVLMANTMQSEG
jgi:hemoglobin-like flavoprotein